MPFTENLAGFFNADEFGIAATWSVGPAAVTVIFDRAYLRQLGLMDGTSPMAMAELASMATVAQGQTLVISGTTYTITGVEPDGTGLVLLHLRVA